MGEIEAILAISSTAMETEMTTQYGDFQQLYHRHWLLPDFSKDQRQRLSATRVVVIGAGGLGLPALLTLAMAGVGTVGIVDGDVVEVTNLHRQWLYTLEDVGQNKAAVAERHLRERNPSIAYHSHPEFLTPQNAQRILREYDCIVDATDSLAARYLINDVAYMLGKPVAYAAVYQYEGEYGLLNVPLDAQEFSPNYRDLYPSLPAASLVPSCREIGVWGPLPNIIGALQATELVKWIARIGTPLVGAIVRIDLRQQRWERFQLAKNPENPLYQPDWQFDPAQYQPVCFDIPEVGWEEVWRNEGELIDIREWWERQQCSAGGRHLPLSQMQWDQIPRDRPVYIYCASGNRSARLVALLRQRGWHNVWNVRGGIAALKWDQIRENSNDKV